MAQSEVGGAQPSWQLWLQTLVSVVAGFALASGFTLYMADQQASAEYQRALKSIKQEMEFDFATAVVVTELVRTDIQMTAQDQEIVQDLPMFETVAMDAAFLKDSLGYRDPDLTLQVGAMATGMKVVNSEIATLREFKLTNGPMSNYKTRKVATEALLAQMVQGQMDAWLRTFKRVVDDSKSFTPPGAST